MPTELPNFMIIGAPKCGTTSIADWLKAHPDVSMSNIKEPFFLMDSNLPEFDHEYPDMFLSNYKECFPCESDSKVVFEATTHYFYQKKLPSFLKKYIPEVKLLVVLRSPSDRIYSWYKFNINHLANLDPSLGFEDMVDLILNGRGEEIRNFCRYESTYASLKDSLDHGDYLVGPEQSATF